MCFMTSSIKHFIMIGVSATGQYSFRQDTDDFFGTGMVVVVMKHTHSLSGQPGMSRPGWV